MPENPRTGAERHFGRKKAQKAQKKGEIPDLSSFLCLFAAIPH
jgi:hypothetical protein